MTGGKMCPFQEYRGNLRCWWCLWTYTRCDRLTPCKKPPKQEEERRKRGELGC